MGVLIQKPGVVSSVMPSWEPSNSPDQKLSEHISKLCIPKSQDGRPSLLLHNLGDEERYDPSSSTVMEEVFDPEVHTCVTNH